MKSLDPAGEPALVLQLVNKATDFCRKAIAYLKVPALEEGDALALSEMDSPVLRELGNGLLVGYLVDEGQSFAYVQNRHLAEAGLNHMQLHEHGLDNLAQIAEEKLEVRQYGPVYSVFLDGNFEASLILLDALWSGELAHLVKGDFAAAFPTRDVLAFCDASSCEGVAELLRIVSRVAGGDHPLTTSLYCRRGSLWVKYTT